MSFSSEVKNELLSIENSPCCEIAQSYGLLLFGRAFSRSIMSILTENKGIADAYAKAIGTLSGKAAEIQLTDAGKYKIFTEDKDAISLITDKLGHTEKGLRRRVNFANFQENCCFASFIRGAFLACGTVTNPEKEYHLEFSVPTKGLGDDLMKIFEEFEPVPKCTARNGVNVVYFKNSTDIEDVLSIMGATENSMQIMGTKVYKDIRNTVNRKVNFENANIARTIAAAAKQYEAIAYLKERVGFENLPDELQQIAKLRYEDRELSNAEICRLLPESITVSGVNHRFRRLMNLAEQIKNNK